MLVESSLHEKAERIVVLEILNWWETTDTRETRANQREYAHGRRTERDIPFESLEVEFVDVL